MHNDDIKKYIDLSKLYTEVQQDSNKQLDENWFTDKIKAGVRWIAHWFERKRAYRLEHGHGIWRTYWVLILLSPIILIGILVTVAVTIFSMELSGAIFDELGGGGWWDDIDA